MVFAGSYASGYIEHAFTLPLVGFPLGLLVTRARRGRRGELELGLLRHPLRRDLRLHLAQALLHWCFLGLCAAMVVLGTLAVYRLALAGGAYLALRVGAWVGLTLMTVLVLVPPRRVFIATNLLIVVASIFLALQVARVTQPPREAVAIDLPLSGEWYVAQGAEARC